LEDVTENNYVILRRFTSASVVNRSAGPQTGPPLPNDRYALIVTP